MATSRTAALSGPRSTLHWVSAAHAIDCEVRLYDRLFKSENPEESGNFLDDLNPRSLEVVTHAKLEPSVRGAAPMTRYQFERLGYFCVDAQSWCASSELVKVLDRRSSRTSSKR